MMDKPILMTEMCIPCRTFILDSRQKSMTQADGPRIITFYEAVPTDHVFSFEY